jgi:hypothetical protein
VVDNITIDGQEIDVSSGDLTLDVAGDINLDADGADINLKDGGTRFGILYNSASNFNIEASVQDKDIIFRGNDGGSGINALTLDMSEAGYANFYGNIILGNGKITSDSTVGSLGLYGGLAVNETPGRISIFGKSVSNTGATYEIARISGASYQTGYALGGGLLFETALNNGSNVLTLSTKMKITAEGYVTMPLQPAFSVNNAPTTQANIAINTVVTITWSGERFDQNADFDLGANSFTAPVTGKYQFNLVIRLESVDIDADYYIISIVTSNVEYKYIFDPVFASDPAYFTVNLSVLADLDASDTAYTTIYQSGGAAQTDITGDATYTYFTGYLVA